MYEVSCEEGVENGSDIKLAKMWVLLSNAYIDDRTACCINHRESSAD